MTASENHPPLWRPAPAVRPLVPGCIHLFLVDLEKVPAANPDHFSLEESQRLDRYHFLRDRNRFSASRTALRAILAGYLGCTPGEVAFQLGSHGKPVLLPSHPHLHFNLSHSDHHMLLAINADSEIGVDLEMVREDLEMEPLAEHYFTPAQQWEFRIARGSERVWKFFELWTATEARLKACGQGLGGNWVQAEAHWTVKHLRIADRFAAAVAIAVENPETKLECWTWPK